MPRLPFEEAPSFAKATEGKPASSKATEGGPAAAKAAEGRPIDAADRAAAVDPRANVVLEASAGTGKTRVLVDRYVNLLKAGVDPANILAITFTRKAAAEMRERIVSTVREAARLGEIRPEHWRELHARLSEVAISTIDAFCLSLLREFPLEADLDPAFRMVDETEMVRLVDEALDRAIRTCRALALSDPAVELTIAQLGDAALRDGLAALLDRRLVVEPVFRRVVGRVPRDLTPESVCQRTASRLRSALADVEGGLDRFLADGPIHHPRFALLVSDLRELTGAAAEGSANEIQPGRLRTLLEWLGEYLLTREGQPRKAWTAYRAADAPSVEAWRRHRERASRLAPAIADAIARFRRDLNAVLARGASRMFAVALDEYRRTLEAHGVVDFPEALWRALELLRQMDEFAQSRFLLEARYHHLLVDELQDTSQAQWELVWRLVDAWAAGVGPAEAAPLAPSIFVVGDRKQSIYGFRDADPTVLERAVSDIAGLRPGGRVRRAIRHSFRAAPALLAFVNDVFDAVEQVEGRGDRFRYSEDDRFPVESGAVQADAALGLLVADDPRVAAAQVAGEIACLLSSAMVRDRKSGLSRPARAGDVAILFRSREGHQAFEAALEARGIAAYVYKGLGFFDADEIKDVFALLRYLANPASDLRAAALMRSRFARLSDAALQQLAPRLARSLRAPAEAEGELDAHDRQKLVELRRSLDRWLSLGDRVTPAELVDLAIRDSAYHWELAGPRAAQARANLKKIRGVLRRIQNRGYATVARIAAHLDRLSAGDESNAVIDAADAVSLMTVHAAKGLEFPIVFLVNLGRGAGGARPPIRILEGDAASEPIVAVGDYVPEADAEATAKEREELKRLLYVALTRARDRLYLSAVRGERGFKPGRGSLGEVLPASLVALIETARSPSIVEWRGTSGSHRLHVCDGSDPVPNPPVTETPPVTLDLEPLSDTPVVARVALHAGAAATDTPAQVNPLDDEALGHGVRLPATVLDRWPAAECLQDVPFATRSGDTIVRGRLRAVMLETDRVTVVDVAAGVGPSDDRRMQVHLDVARRLFPGRTVAGLLLHPGGERRFGAGES